MIRRLYFAVEKSRDNNNEAQESLENIANHAKNNLEKLTQEENNLLCEILDNTYGDNGELSSPEFFIYIMFKIGNATNRLKKYTERSLPVKRKEYVRKVREWANAYNSLSDFEMNIPNIPLHPSDVLRGLEVILRRKDINKIAKLYGQVGIKGKSKQADTIRCLLKELGEKIGDESEQIRAESLAIMKYYLNLPQNSL